MTESSISFNTPKVAVTADREQVLHVVSDFQLELIENHGGSTTFDISLVLLGAFAGLLKDLVAATTKLWKVGTIDAAEAAAAGGAILTLAAGASLFIAARQKKSQLKTVISAIRARPAQRQ